jgi:hypothetical protein
VPGGAGAAARGRRGGAGPDCTAHCEMLLAADTTQLVFDAMPALIACSVALCWAAAGCC